MLILRLTWDADTGFLFSTPRQLSICETCCRMLHSLMCSMNVNWTSVSSVNSLNAEKGWDLRPEKSLFTLFHPLSRITLSNDSVRSISGKGLEIIFIWIPLFLSTLYLVSFLSFVGNTSPLLCLEDEEENTSTKKCLSSAFLYHSSVFCVHACMSTWVLISKRDLHKRQERQEWERKEYEEESEWNAGREIRWNARY